MRKRSGVSDFGQDFNRRCADVRILVRLDQRKEKSLCNGHLDASGEFATQQSNVAVRIGEKHCELRLHRFRNSAENVDRRRPKRSLVRPEIGQDRVDAFGDPMRKRAVKIASRTRLSVSQPNASAKAATDCGSLSAERAARQRASADGLRRSIAVGSAAVSLSGGFRTSGMTDDLLQFRCDLVNWQDPCRAADLDQFSWHIRNGKDKMPPEAAGRANDATVWNLIIYIRNMSKPQGSTSAK